MEWRKMIELEAEEHSRSVGGVVFSPDGRLLASADHWAVMLWDVSTGRAIRSHKTPGESVREGVAFSPDGRLLAVGAENNIVHLWGVDNGQEIGPFEIKDAIGDVAFSPDGRLLARATWDGVTLCDARNGVEVCVLKGHEPEVGSIAFSPSGRYLASTSTSWREKSVKLWEVDSCQEICTLSTSPDSVRDLAFSPDGRTLGAGLLRTVKLWEVNSQKEIHTLPPHNSDISGIAFSPNRRLLAVATEHDSVSLWDTATWQKVGEGGWSGTYSVAISPDGRLLASGGRESILLNEISSCLTKP